MNCSLKEHVQAAKGSFPANVRNLLQAGAPDDMVAGGGYSVRKYLTRPAPPTIEGPNGNNVSIQDVAIGWQDPAANLCNAATRFAVSLSPGQSETIPGVAAPSKGTTVGYDLYYQTHYTVTVVSSNASGTATSQSTFRTATQPTPIDLAPNGEGGISTGNPTLSWIDPGIVPATKFRVTVSDRTHQPVQTFSATIAGTAYQPPAMLETDTEYSWSVEAMYPGNTSFGPVASARFTTVGSAPGPGA
jgi:hypothetical protein